MPEEHHHLDRKTFAEAAVIALARTVLSLAIILLLYIWIPVGSGSGGKAPLIILAAALVLWLAVVIRQLIRLRRSAHPLLRVGEALVGTVALVVVIFALVYMVIATGQPNSFSEPLDKGTAVYFSMTITSTVGFGDIVPKTTIAREVVTFQMFLNLLVLGVAIQGITQAARLGMKAQRKRTTPHPDAD